MSEFTLVDVEFKDEKSLLASLQELGYCPEVFDVPQNLYGFQGDERSQKAHIVIRRKHLGRASNDAGFTRLTDGKYKLIISDYDKKVKSINIDKIKAVYFSKVTEEFFNSKSEYYVQSKETLADGRIKVRVITT